MKKEFKPKCPVCHSETTAVFKDKVNNGVVGGGYSSYVKQSYNICLDCGVLFKSQEQLDILRNEFIK